MESRAYFNSKVLSKVLITCIKILLFVIILYFFSYKFLKAVSFKSIQEAFSSTALGFVFLALLAYLLKRLMLVFRFNVALKVFNGNMLFKDIFLLIYKMDFLNFLFPIPDSEDVIKYYLLSKNRNSTSKSINILRYDRIVGVSFIIFIIPVFIYKNQTLLSHLYPNFNFALLLVCLCVFLSFVILFNQQILDRITSIFVKHKWPFHSFLNKIHGVDIKELSIYLVSLSFLATLIHAIFGILCPYLLLLSLHVSVDFISLFLFLPMFYFALIMPVSIQGLGLFETVLVFILIKMGVSENQAIIVGILHFIIDIINILIAGLLFVFTNNYFKFEDVKKIIVSLKR